MIIIIVMIMIMMIMINIVLPLDPWTSAWIDDDL
jgi:hypothetical protein